MENGLSPNNTAAIKSTIWIKEKHRRNSGNAEITGTNVSIRPPFPREKKTKIVAVCKEITVASYRYDNGFIVSDAYKIETYFFKKVTVLRDLNGEVRRRCTRFT